MPGTIRYDVAATAGTLMDNTSGQGATLAQLGNGSGAMGLNYWDNTPTTGRGDFWADFELNVNYPIVPNAGGNIDLYLLESLDASSYVDGTSGNVPVTNINSYVGSFSVRAITGYQRMSLRQIVLPPTRFNSLLVNNSGAGFANSTSGMTLRILPYREQY